MRKEDRGTACIATAILISLVIDMVSNGQKFGMDMFAFDVLVIILDVILIVGLFLEAGKPASSKYQVTAFVIHSEQDKAAAQKMASSLAKHKIRVIDEDEVCPIGYDLTDIVNETIGKADCVIAIVSDKSAEDHFFRRLIDQSLSLSRKIIPVLVDNMDELPRIIGGYRTVNTAGNFNKAAESLARYLVAN